MTSSISRNDMSGLTFGAWYDTNDPLVLAEACRQTCNVSFMISPARFARRRELHRREAAPRTSRQAPSTASLVAPLRQRNVLECEWLLVQRGRLPFTGI